MSSEPVEATAFDLARTVEQLTAEVDRLRSLVEQPDRAAPASVAPGRKDEAVSADEQIDRRSALRRAGLMAAGAVTGGAAIVAATASPAAAATLTGSGSPGVTGTGTGGDGVVGTTNAASSSGVYGYTAVGGAYAVFARAGSGGTALVAEGSGQGGYVARFNSTSGQTALNATTTGQAVEVEGSTATGSLAPTVLVRHGNDGAGTTVPAVSIQSSGHGLLALGTGAGPITQKAGLASRRMDIGLLVSECRVAMQLVKNPILAPPPQRTHAAVAGMVDYDGVDLWVCVQDGTPGTWRRMGGTKTAGAFEVLPAPVRIYDSRPGSVPTQIGPKTRVPSGGTRVLDTKVESSGVPAGATAVMVTVLLVNAATGNGNATVWANGVAKPQANTLVWGGSSGRFTATAVSAVDAQARIQFSTSLETDVVIDVVGFYR